MGTKRKREEKPKKVLLSPLPPDESSKPTLVLGLESTLCVIDRSNKVLLRPGVHELLNAVRDCYELVAFSSMEKKQADRLFKAVNRGGNWIPTILSRGACAKDMKVFGNYFKDLSLLGRDMSRVVALDANLREYSLSRENLVPVKPFTGEDPEDYELFRVEPFLQEVAIAGFSNMPEAVKEFLEQEDELEEFDKQRVALFEAGGDPGTHRTDY